MKENTLFYIFYILFWIYLVYSLYNKGKFKEDYMSFPTAIFTESQRELSETDFGKRTIIKEEIEPQLLLDILRPRLSLKKNSILDKVGLKKQVMDSITVNINVPSINGNPNSNYDNPFIFSYLQNKTDALTVLYEPLPHELIVYDIDPKEAIAKIQNNQEYIVNKNVERTQTALNIQPFLLKIQGDLLKVLNTPSFLNKMKPFKDAILERYEIGKMKPLFIYRENYTNKTGAIIEGLLYRYNKYFIYNFVVEVTINEVTGSYDLHSFDIIAFNSSEDSPDSFGNYIENSLNPRTCILTDTISHCNPRNVPSYENMKQNIKDMNDTYFDELSYRCVGKYTFNRDECISPDPNTQKIGKWVHFTYK